MAMFVTRCPNDSRPVSPSAKPQHMHCSGCGFDGQPAADVMEEAP